MLTSVWPHDKRRPLKVSFVSADKLELKWRYGLCEILFGAPSDLGILMFETADAQENDRALNGLLTVLGSKGTNAPNEFAECAKFLQNAIHDGKSMPSDRAVRAAQEVVEQRVKILPRSSVRERLLCAEMIGLLKGFRSPREATSQLALVSNVSLRTSPSISQIAFVHLIELNRLLKSKAKADALFLSGKRIYLEGNPTPYAYRYWSPVLEQYIHDFPQGHKGNSKKFERFVTPHNPWRF